jgi:hypothetical protein
VAWRWPQSDEEPVDTMPAIREQVKPLCTHDYKEYEVSAGASLVQYQERHTDSEW